MVCISALYNAIINLMTLKSYMITLELIFLYYICLIIHQKLKNMSVLNIFCWLFIAAATVITIIAICQLFKSKI